MRINGHDTADHWPGAEEGPVGRLLASATAPALGDELLGEEAAASAFRAAAAMPVPPAIRPGRPRRITIAIAIQAACASVVVLGGVAVAAYTGVLPNPLVDVTTSLPGPPSANPSHAVTGSTMSRSPGEPAPSGPITADQPVPASFAGLGRAYEASGAGGPSMGSDAFAILVAAAGSVDRVADFCADILARRPGSRDRQLPTDRTVMLHDVSEAGDHAVRSRVPKGCCQRGP
jgi:hypothetical protein